MARTYTVNEKIRRATESELAALSRSIRPDFRFRVVHLLSHEAPRNRGWMRFAQYVYQALTALPLDEGEIQSAITVARAMMGKGKMPDAPRAQQLHLFR